MIITAIGKLQAREGFEFIYTGPQQQCRECKYKNVCITLERGNMYRVSKVRNVEHPCPIHFSGIKVIEVEKINKGFIVDDNNILAGSIIKLRQYPCKHIECLYWTFCNSITLLNTDKYKVTSIKRSFTCSMGRSLKEVTVENI